MRIFLILLFACNLLASPAMAAANGGPAAGAAASHAAQPAAPAKPAADTTPAPFCDADCLFNLRVAGAIVSIVLATAAVLWLGMASEVLRDGVPDDFLGTPLNLATGGAAPPKEQYRRCYSLAQTQITWWFWIVIVSFLIIACVNADPFGGLTAQALALTGIGAGTALGAAIIEQAKKDNDGPLKTFNEAATALKAATPGAANLPALRHDLNEAAQKLSSDGFFSDILSDGDGISLHRFQSFAWTLVLGIVFLVYVVSHLAMPQLSVLELSLLGISAGTYLGFKVPE